MFDAISGSLANIGLDLNLDTWIPIRASKEDNRITHYCKNSETLRLTFHPLSGTIWFDTNLPKLIRENNQVLATEDELELIQQEFDLEMIKLTGLRLPGMPLWRARRIEFAHDFKLSDPRDKQSYIDTFKRAELGFYTREDHSTTAQHSNKSVKYHLYDKAEECKARHESKFYGVTNNVIRFEEKWMRDKLDRDYPKVTLGEMLTDKQACKAIRQKLYRCGIVGIVDSRDIFLTKLDNLKLRADFHSNLMRFLEIVNSEGKKAAQRAFSASTYYNYVKCLRHKGLGLYYVDQLYGDPINFFDLP